MNNLGLSFCTKNQREFRNQTIIVGIEEHNGTDVNIVQCRRESRIKDGRLKPKLEIKQNDNSDSIQDINEILKATPIF